LTVHTKQLFFLINDEPLDADTHVISLGGELDLHAAPDLRERMSTLINEGKSLLIDLTQATFIDSSAIGVLVGGLKRLRESGGRMVLACEHPNILAVFEITGLDRTFSIHGSREDAVAALRRGEGEPNVDGR
jgi:anti-sigma B factor antagonist